MREKQGEKGCSISVRLNYLGAWQQLQATTPTVTRQKVTARQ